MLILRLRHGTELAHSSDENAMLPQCVMRLFGFGQPIVSDNPIVGALPASDGDDGLSSLTITCVSPRPSNSDLIYRVDGETLVFAPPRVGEYHCSKHGITIVPEPDADAEEIEALLIATALPATQWMQGHFMLHASAVVLPGHVGAIAVTGISGSGKSTIAAELVERGGQLVADDSVRIAFENGIWTAAGLAGGLFMTGHGSENRHFMPISNSLVQAPIEAIFVLGERSETSTMAQFDAGAAVGQLLAMQHRPRIPAILKTQPQMLEIAAGIARTLPIYGWQRRRGSVALEQFEWDSLMLAGNKG